MIKQPEDKADHPLVSFKELYAYQIRAGLYEQSVMEAFQVAIKDFYAEHKRSFGWRATTDPYTLQIVSVYLKGQQFLSITQPFLEVAWHSFAK